MNCHQCGVQLVEGANYCHLYSAAQTGFAPTHSSAYQFLGYCAGSGVSITTNKEHFKRLECGQLQKLITTQIVTAGSNRLTSISKIVEL
jgi:hypothetical protein